MVKEIVEVELMTNALMALMDLFAIVGWILIGISGMILKDIIKEARPEKTKLHWQLMYLILPLLLLYPSFLFYQYLYGDVPLSSKIITGLIVMLSIGSLLLLYLAHQIRLLQLRREISGVAASVLVIYLSVSVYLSFQIGDFGELLNNLLFTTSMMMLALSLFYLGNYTLAFSKVIKVAPLLYIGGVLVLLPGLVRPFLTEPKLLALFPHLFFLKAIGTAGIVFGGLLMFMAADTFKRRVLEFAVKIK